MGVGGVSEILRGGGTLSHFYVARSWIVMFAGCNRNMEAVVSFVGGECGAFVAEDCVEDRFKSLTEISVEVGVNDGVEGRVKVADPEDENDDPFRCGTQLVATQRRRQVPCEKGQPAQDEDAHYDSQGPGRLVFSLHTLHCE